MPNSPPKLTFAFPFSADSDMDPAARVQTSPGVLPTGLPNTLTHPESTLVDPVMLMKLLVNVGKVTGSDLPPMAKLPLPLNPEDVSVSVAPCALPNPLKPWSRVFWKFSVQGKADGVRL